MFDHPEALLRVTTEMQSGLNRPPSRQASRARSETRDGDPNGQSYEENNNRVGRPKPRPNEDGVKNMEDNPLRRKPRPVTSSVTRSPEASDNAETNSLSSEPRESTNSRPEEERRMRPRVRQPIYDDDTSSRHNDSQSTDDRPSRNPNRPSSVLRHPVRGASRQRGGTSTDEKGSDPSNPDRPHRGRSSSRMMTSPDSNEQGQPVRSSSRMSRSQMPNRPVSKRSASESPGPVRAPARYPAEVVRVSAEGERPVVRYVSRQHVNQSSIVLGENGSPETYVPSRRPRDRNESSIKFGEGEQSRPQVRARSMSRSHQSSIQFGEGGLTTVSNPRPTRSPSALRVDRMDRSGNDGPESPTSKTFESQISFSETGLAPIEGASVHNDSPATPGTPPSRYVGGYGEDDPVKVNPNSKSFGKRESYVLVENDQDRRRRNPNPDSSLSSTISPSSQSSGSGHPTGRRRAPSANGRAEANRETSDPNAPSQRQGRSQDSNGQPTRRSPSANHSGSASRSENENRRQNPQRSWREAQDELQLSQIKVGEYDLSGSPTVPAPNAPSLPRPKNPSSPSHANSNGSVLRKSESQQEQNQSGDKKSYASDGGGVRIDPDAPPPAGCCVIS